MNAPASAAVALPERWPDDPTELEQLVGPVTASRFTAGLPADQIKAWEAIRRLAGCADDGAWIAAAAGAITDSARCSSWRGNWEADHAVASFAYHDGRRRDSAAGRGERCQRHSIYARAFRAAMIGQGHPTPTPVCGCEAGSTEGVRPGRQPER